MKLPGPLTADQEKQLQTIRCSARHLLSLINDLLDVAKIDSGKVELRKEPIDCREVIDEVVTALGPMAHDKGLSLEVDVPAQRVLISSDRRALSQILINLSSNAIKFTEAGYVRLSLGRAERDGRREVVVAVADSGRGIRIEDKGKLFQAFSQVADQAMRPQEGTGLGLHLSQRLANLLGGEITFESELGKGSVFVLHLAEA
jgi:protein-histidine pros-kinase